MAAGVVICPAAAGGCRHCLPAGKLRWGSGGARSGAEPHPVKERVGNADQQSAGKPADSQTLAAPIYGGQWTSPGCAAAGCGAHAPSFPTTKNLEALIYGRQIRAAGASSWNRALPGRQTSVGVWGSAKRSGASPSEGARRQCRQKIRKKLLRIRRLRPLKYMAADSRRQNRRQQVGIGTADADSKTPAA